MQSNPKLPPLAPPAATKPSKNALDSLGTPATIRDEGTGTPRKAVPPTARTPALRLAVPASEEAASASKDAPPPGEDLDYVFPDDELPPQDPCAWDQPYDIAKDFLRREHLHRAGKKKPSLTLRYWRGSFHTWDGMVYKPLDEELLVSRIMGWLSRVQKPSDPSSARAVRTALVSLTHNPSTDSCTWLGLGRPAGELLSVLNGILSLRHDHDPILHPHNPALFATHCLPLLYNASATCPQWLSFLSQSLESPEKDAASASKNVALLQEWFGYCLTQDTSLQKFLLVVGPPASGKSTITTVLTELIGSSRAPGIDFAQLSHHFGLQLLMDAQVVFCSEVNTARRQNTPAIIDAIKRITGQDRVAIHRKHLPDLELALKCRLVLVCNEIPRFADASLSVDRRMLILRLVRSFRGAEDFSLVKKLLTELPGILNWSLQGLSRLRSQRDLFTDPPAAASTRSLVRKASAPLLDFIEEKCVTGKPNDSILCAHLWNAWTRWCATNNTHPGSTQRFGIKLHACCPHVTRVRIQRAYWYQGIALLPLKGVGS